MTIEESRNELDELTIYVEHAFTEEHRCKSFEALRMSIAALEKQMQKEPEHKYITGTDDKVGFYCCPLCDYRPLYINMKYCIKCGQAIKWE